MFDLHNQTVMSPRWQCISAEGCGIICCCETKWNHYKARFIWWRHQMKTFSALLPFVWGIHRSQMNSPRKNQWRWALMFSLICARLKGWLSDRDAGDLRCHWAHYDVSVIICIVLGISCCDFLSSIWVWVLSNNTVALLLLCVLLGAL